MSSTWVGDLRVAVPSWLEARLYVAAAYVVTWGVIDRLEPPPAQSPVDDGLLAWDGTWYAAIARDGYVDAADEAMRFFPLYPLLGRWLGWIGDRPDIALVVVANLAALVAGVLLHRLTLRETGDPALARRAVRLLALFPSAFVLVLAYSEALFLALAIGLVLTVKEQRWWTAAALGFLAGLTRPVAGLLALPAAAVAWRSGARSPGALASIVSAPVGSFSFLLWAELAHDDWQAPVDRQRELRGDAAEPITRWFRGLGDAVDLVPPDIGIRDEGELLHVLAVVVVIVLTVVTVRRLSFELAVYTVASAIVLVAADNLNSLERYALAAFPLVIAAAIVSRHRWLDNWLPTASAVGLVSLTTLALNGVYVP